METQKLIARALMFLLLMVLDAYMFYELVAVLKNPVGEVAPALIALLSGTIGGITMALGLAAKDFFNPQ